MPKASKTKTNKLFPLADIIAQSLHQKNRPSPEILFEYKPDWLTTYPSLAQIEKQNQIIQVHSALTEGKVNLLKTLAQLPERKLNQKQAYDIWVGEPFNFAIEFDEKQHFNQFRLMTLAFYKNLKTGYSIKAYDEYCRKSPAKKGTSGFQKLKSADPLFPELLSGIKQDNRLRQRAFRDYLKDISPLHHNFGETVRIPYQIVDKIKDFDTSDLKIIGNYFKKQKLSTL